MVPDEELQATIQRLEPVRNTFEERPRSTIEPRDSERAAERHAADVMASIAAGTGGLVLERTLGEGGMGIVRLGQQPALRRGVAVKTLREEFRDPRSTLRLLRESWITGMLEHPNVVPVHDLGADDRGGPRMVMKRIEGVEWTQLMHDADTVEERFHARSLLEWNLSILQQVTQALAFAHSRGILHRDLKPENVMIGSFGEVYVVDWGIAVALRDDGSGLLPLAADVKEMTGTPAYMAPEMLGLPGSRLSERTDVYLLGAVLYEILTGQPPHQAATLAAMVPRIARSLVTFPDGLPEELERVCRRALERDPDARFENVVQFRLAVQAYLQHRGAMRLCEEAQESLATLRTALAAPEAGDRDLLYGLYGAARFGFMESLRAWKENHAAREALTEATTRMVEYELAQGDPGAASTLVAELGDENLSLRQRVEEAKRARDADLARLEAQAKDFDPRTGVRTRTFLGVMLGIAWSIAPLVQQFTGAVGTHARWILFDLADIVVMLALGFWARDTLHRTAFNRRMGRTVVFLFVSQILLTVGAWLLALPMRTVSALLPFLWFVVSAHAAIALEKWLAPAAATYALTFLVSARWPELRWFAMSLSNVALTLNIVVLGAATDPEIANGDILRQILAQQEKRRALLRAVSRLGARRDC